MPVAEKYRVLRDFKFNGRQYARGDALPRSQILEVQAQPGAGDKLGSLLRTRFIDLDPVTKPLGSMTKDELIEHARDLGVSVNANWRKADIVEAIEEAPHG